MKKNLFKRCIFIFFIVILLMVVGMIMLKYDVEGEKELPYEIDKIFLVSTVDGKVNEDPNNIWNIGITEVNDIYIYINKMTQKDETIKEIKVENFNIVKEPQKGSIKLLRPTGDLNNLYTYSQQNYLEDSIVYTGASIDELKSLEIANTGGVIAFRLSLEDLGSYVSNEAQEITYDGTLLSNLGINIDEIKFAIDFDLIITTSENVNYKGTLHLSLPLDTVITKGSSNIEITDFSNVIFKRI